MSVRDTHRGDVAAERRRSARPPGRRLRLPVVLLGIAVLVVLVVMAGSRRPGTPAPTAPSLEWQSISPPGDAIRRVSLMATPMGFALLDRPGAGGTIIWASANGLDWTPSPIELAPLGLTARHEELLAFRGYDGLTLRFDAGRWVPADRVELPAFARSGYNSGRSGVIDIDGELLVHSVEGELYRLGATGDFALVIDRGVWWNPDADVWRRFTAPFDRNRCRPPFEASLDYLPLFASAHGVAAMVPLEITGPNLTWPVCDPQIWHSDDGTLWTVAGGFTGFEPGSFVYDVARGGDTLYAVGGAGEMEPAMWHSEDGLEWRRVSWPPGEEPFALSRIAAGRAGIVVIGSNATGSANRGWFSRDGLCWTALPSYITPVRAAVGAESVVVADARPDGPFWVAATNERAAAQNCDVDVSG